MFKAKHVMYVWAIIFMDEAKYCDLDSLTLSKSSKIYRFTSESVVIQGS